MFTVRFSVYHTLVFKLVYYYYYYYSHCRMLLLAGAITEMF